MFTVRESIIDEFDGAWVGEVRFPVKQGDVGFLLELTPVASGRSRVEMRPHPVRTALSYEEVLYGNVSSDRTNVEALGMAKVVEALPNGRGKVKTLWGNDAQDALHSLGYPEMIFDLPLADKEVGQ